MSLDLNSTIIDLIKAVNNASTIPVATSSALGGIKIGYTASGANLPVALSSEKAYVALTKSAVTSALGYTPASTDYYWANIKISSSSSNTTSPRFQSMRARNTVYGVARGSTTGTPTATILHTGIKWVSGGYMPVLHFTGYAYGLQSPVEFKVGFYIYSDKIGYCGATNMGAWKPEIRLFRETRNNVDYVAVALVGKCYFLGLSVGLQEEMANVSSNIDLSSDKWSFEFLTTYTTDDIPEGNTPPHATCCTVPYKQILNNLGNINFKLAGTTQATYTGADTSIDFNIPNATTSASGLMTAAMVTKLNGIAEGADNVSVTQTLTSGIEIGSVKVGNTTTKLYAPAATEVDLSGYVPTNSTSEISVTTTGDMYLTSNADFRLDASGGNGTTCINMDGVDSYIGITASDIRLIGDDNIGITFTQRDINISGENVYLSGYVYANGTKIVTESSIQSHFSAFEQGLTEARVDLSNYFKELDTIYGDNYNVSAGTDGIHWNNYFGLIGDHGDYQGKYWGNVPIVAGDNVTFTVDSTNQVVKVSANLSNYATTTYVDSAVSALVGGAPETLNALNELAAALGNDPNFATTVSTQIGKKQATITGAATTITSSNLTASRALVSDANGKVAVSAVTSTELGYLDGVTSNIQTQLNGKLSTTGKAASATVADSANAVAWSKVSGKPTFATVATSGSYNDLSNKPTIPTTLPASDVYAWAKAKTKPSYSYSEITGKPTLATVATSGSYNDLSNKPTIPAAVSVTQKLTSGTEIGSVTIGSTTTKLYAPTATSVDLSGYLPLSGGTITGNILFSNSNAQGSQPNLKWKTINSKTPYVGYCTASADGTFLVASIGGTSYTTGLSIGGSSGNLLWKGTRVATTADIPSLSNYSTLANTIKALSISGKTITYTKGDGTTGTLTTQDTDSQLRQYYTHANMDVELPIIYSYNTTVSGTGDYKTTYGGVKAGFTFNPYTDTLRVGNINLTGDNLYMGAVALAKGDDWVDFMLNGGDAGIYFANDENGDPYVDLYGNVTVNGEPIGSGGGGNVIQSNSSYNINAGEFLYLIPDAFENDNDFVGEVEVWIKNIDMLEGFLTFYANDEQIFDEGIWIPDDAPMSYIKFSFLDDCILVQGNDTNTGYVYGFYDRIDKPSGRLFYIQISNQESASFQINTRTVEYL